LRSSKPEPAVFRVGRAQVAGMGMGPAEKQIPKSPQRNLCFEVTVVFRPSA